MRNSRSTQAVLLLAVMVLLFSGCDFMKSGGGGSATTYELSKLTLTMQGKGVIAAQPAPLAGGLYPRGTTVQLKATGNLRNSFWTFVVAIMLSGMSGAIDGLNVTLFSNWSGDLAGSANPASIQINKDTSVQAVYSRMGVLSIETPGATMGGSGGPSAPPYAEISYSAGRPSHADFYDSATRTRHYMTSSFIFNSSGQCTVVYARVPEGQTGPNDEPAGTLLCTTNYTYTSSGDISMISSVSSNFTMDIQYEYDSLGRIASMSMNQGTSYGQTMYCSYGDSGDLQQLDSYQNGVYNYYICTSDSNGNVTKLDIYDQDGVLNPGQGFSLVYDSNGLLNVATLSMGSGSMTSTLGWVPL